MKQPIRTCPPRTAVAYARYSSSGQRDVSIEQQLKDIRAFADREGYTILHEYADQAKSGFKNTESRLEFQAMISAAVSGSFDTVLCWKLDRFGRNRKDSAVYKDQLSGLGVSVVSIMEPIPEGSAGVLTVGMLETLAEWYSRQLAENVTRGLRANAMKCLYNGTKVLGYRRGSDNHYEIIPEEAATVRKIFSMYVAGMSAQRICDALNSAGLRTSRGVLFRPETILRIIANERYAGVYIYGDIRIPDGMPAIISGSDWEAAQLMRKKTARYIDQHAVDFLLTGKAFCGYCGKAMIGDSGTSKSGTTYRYYACQGHKSRSGCSKKNVRKEILEDFVIGFILDHCFTEEQMNTAADLIMGEMEQRKKKSPLASMKKEYDDLQKKIENTNRAISAGVYGESTLVMLHDFEEQEKDLRKSIFIQEQSETQLLDRDRVLFFLQRFAKTDRTDPVQCKRLINTFVNAIYVYDDHLKIITNVSESSARIPLESLPDADPPCSDSFTCYVLNATHPNTAALLYCVGM